MFETPFSKIPEELFSRVANLLHNYSIGLIKLKIGPKEQKTAIHIGSATLISIGKNYGLLTAYHVTEELKDEYELGLTITTNVTNFKINKNNLYVIPIGKPISDEYGPDISFILLSPYDVSTIKAFRSFFPISTEKDEILLNPPPIDWGLWVACGSPGERTIEERPDIDTINYAIQDLCLMGGVEQEQIISDYDYFLFDIEAVKSKNLPQSFEGMSGGGLWQVLIKKTEKEDFIPTKYILSGVIFYQWIPDNGPKFLRCHGRRSIYQNVYQKIEEKFA